MIKFQLYLIALTISGINLVNAGPVASKGEANLVDYLSRYGYLKPLDPRLGRLRTYNELKEAVKSFQRFAGLKETGDLTDAKTLEMIQTPRCGLNDFGPSDRARRKRRYALQGTQWKKNDLTFRIENWTRDIYWKDTRKIIIEALNMWSSVSELKFTESRDRDADILFKFIRGYHKDGYPFDGKGGVLAHAFYPHHNKGIAGDVHFDDDEKFTKKNDGVNLKWVAVHELGHSLGLGHSSHDKSIMYPFYRGYVPNMKLHNDDIRGIRHLYGSKKDRKKERATSKPRVTDPPIKPGIPDKCYTGIDAMVHTSDGYTYAFKGEYFWPIDDQGSWTNELKIHKFWPGLENDIDAAVTLSDGKTLIFKGGKYWEFRGRAMYKGPNPISDKYLNLPEELINMDAAFVWGENGRIYFFKGKNYWRYNERLKKVDHGYPKPIKGAWKGVPDNLDAAMQWKNGKSYFFKGIRYYGLDDYTLKVPSIYPRRIATYWMGCSAEGLINNKLAPLRQGNETLATTESSTNVSSNATTKGNIHSTATSVSFSCSQLLFCLFVLKLFF